MGDIVGMDLAIIVVTISILLSGIAIGLGRGFGYKKIESFGVEELFQSIVNGAIIGALAIIIELIKGISASLVETECSTGDAIAEVSCVLTDVNNGVFSLLQETVKAMNIVGYYQSLSLNFGSFSIQPFVNLESILEILTSQANSLEFLLVLTALNINILNFFAENALLLLFPIGLVLRSFFATRRLGGFLIAVAIGAYVLYPAFILIFPVPDYEINVAKASIQNFTTNENYAPWPIIDLNDNNAIASKIDNMSMWSNATEPVDLSGDLTVVTQANSNAISKITMYSVFAPIFSLIVTIVFIKELTNILGGEIGLSSVM